jgi:hypothetical protein
MHKEKIDLSYVVNEEFFEAAGKKMSRLQQHKNIRNKLRVILIHYSYLLVAAITNLERKCVTDSSSMQAKCAAYLRHRRLPLETTPYSVINTLRFPPCLLDTMITIGLMAPMM